MLIAAGMLSLLIWIYLLLGRGQFWRIRIVSPLPEPGAPPARIAAVVPGRDEADVVGRAVTSLVKQTGANALHIFLVDDGSADGTAQAARSAAGEAGSEERLTVIQGQALPRGWAGKMWALHQGVAQARAFHPEFFLFTDADIVHAPDSLSQLVAIARLGHYDLASFMVKLHCKTPAEKLLIPAFVFFFFKLYPPAWVADSQRGTAAAAGGCILVRPAALDGAGGIEAIRSEVIDDCALAARVKRKGGRLWLGASATTASVRPYLGLSGIGGMISRTAFNQLRHSALLLLVSLAGMLATYLLPPALLLFSHRLAPAALGGAAWVLMTFSFLPILRVYRLSPLWGLALPLIAVFYMGATVQSAFKYWSGRGGEWKGRVQDPANERR
jgi:hopene-associated glycosyltransferase HpnB